MPSDQDKKIEALLGDAELLALIKAALARKGVKEDRGAKDMDDALQQVLLALAMRWRATEPPDKVADAAALITEIANRKGIDLGRTGGKAKKKVVATDDLDESAAPVDDGTVEPLDARRALRAVDTLLESDELKKHAALLRTVAEGGSLKEHAEKEGKHETTISKQKVVATTLLAKKLAALGLANIGLPTLAALALASAVGGYGVYHFVRAPVPVAPRLPQVALVVDAGAPLLPVPSASSPPSLPSVGAQRAALVEKAKGQKKAKQWLECLTTLVEVWALDAGPPPPDLASLSKECNEGAAREMSAKGPLTPSPAPPKVAKKVDAGARKADASAP